MLRNATETPASAVKSPLFFFPRQFFARALQSESLEQQASPEPSSLSSWLCTILPLPGAWAPASACSFVFTGFCHILRLGSFVVCSSPIRITLECKQIVLFSSRQSPLLYVRSFFATLAIFHVTHHVTALDQ